MAGENGSNVSSNNVETCTHVGAMWKNWKVIGSYQRDHDIINQVMLDGVKCGMCKAVLTIKEAEEITGLPIPVEIVPNDIPSTYKRIK